MPRKTKQQEIEELQAKLDEERQNYDTLRKQYADLLNSYNKLHEADQRRKKAGRKPHDNAWKEQYQKFNEMYNAGLSQKEIMQQLNISRATYFRLKKLVKGDENE